MHRLKKLAVAVIFVTGCATGLVAREVFTVPQALAQSTAPRWSYFCIDENDRDDLEKKLNQAGAQGWELVSSGAGPKSFSIYWCLRRPAP